MGMKNEGLSDASNRINIGKDVREYSLKHTQSLFANAQAPASRKEAANLLKLRKSGSAALRSPRPS